MYELSLVVKLLHLGAFITPRACTQGVKQLVCQSVVISTKITRSRDIGIWANCKYNQTIRWGKKLAWICFKSTTQAKIARNIEFCVDHTYSWPCAFCSCAQPTVDHVLSNYNKAPCEFVVPETVSVQDKQWICKTCHSALKRGRLPAQAKANNGCSACGVCALENSSWGCNAVKFLSIHDIIDALQMYPLCFSPV